MSWGVATVHLPSLLCSVLLYFYSSGMMACPLIPLFIDGTSHVPSFKPLGTILPGTLWYWCKDT